MTTRTEELTITAERYSYEQLESRLKLVEDICRSMAHNIRGAAAGIKMMNDLLMNMSATGEGCTVAHGKLSVKEITHCINSSSTSLIGTLNDMMEIVNRDLNDGYAFQDCDITQVSEGVVNQLCGTILQKHAKIVFNFAAKHFLYAKTYLENALYNLVSNALKYSRPDVPPVITISSEMSGGRPVIEVADNGMGIDMSRYGDKVFKLNQVFHKGYDSKGIGLYITKEQIESLGGKITVESEVDKGSIFTLAL